MKKNVVIGLGEIGNPIYKLLSKGQVTVGFDKDSTLMNQSKFKKFENMEIVTVAHIFGEAIQRVYNGESVSALFEF